MTFSRICRGLSISAASLRRNAPPRISQGHRFFAAGLFLCTSLLVGQSDGSRAADSCKDGQPAPSDGVCKQTCADGSKISETETCPGAPSRDPCKDGQPVPSDGVCQQTCADGSKVPE